MCQAQCLIIFMHYLKKQHTKKTTHMVDTMISKLYTGKIWCAEFEVHQVTQLEKLELKNSYDYKVLANHK